MIKIMDKIMKAGRITRVLKLAGFVKRKKKKKK